jgi:nucleoside-diphosphate-sugar epimerase
LLPLFVAFSSLRKQFSPILMDVETLLVTGATGFVGSHVVAATRSGTINVRALVRKQADVERLEAQGVSCIRGSLDDAAAVRQGVSGADAVLHLAAATKARNADEYRAANVAGTQAVVDAIRATGGSSRLIYLSSLAAVGPSYGDVPVTRDTLPRPLTEYGRTKLAGEKVVEAAADAMEVVILRAPAVYGPRDRDVFEFFKMARQGLMPLPSGPVRRLQMIHAADLARALVLAATKGTPSGVYHVAEARSYVWEDMARMVAKAVGRENARIVRVPGPLIAAAAAVSEAVVGLFGKSTIFNRDKARELLAPGWLCETELARRDFEFEAQIPLQAGLTETAKWYFENGWL